MRRPVLVMVALVLASGAVAAVDRLTPLDPLRTAFSTLYGTAEQALYGTAARVPGEATFLKEATPPKEELEAENARLRADLLVARQQAADSGQKSRLAEGVAAHVVAFGRSQMFTLDVGGEDGVRTDLTVVNAHGLVGRVSWSGPSTSTVTLITDPGTTFGARMAGSGEMGLVTGLPERGLLRLRLLRADAEVRIGDVVETLGSANQRPYVSGVPIGGVTEIEQTPGAFTRTVLVRPFARLSAPGLLTVVIPDRAQMRAR